MHARAGIIAASLIGLLAISGCAGGASASPDSPSTELVFATPPGTDDPEKQAIMGDLSGLVGQATGRTVQNLQPADYLGVMEAVRNGSVDVAIRSQLRSPLLVADD